MNNDINTLFMVYDAYWGRLKRLDDKINLLKNSTYFYINKQILENNFEIKDYDVIILSTGKRYLEGEIDNLKDMIIQNSKNKLVLAVYNYVISNDDIKKFNCSKKIKLLIALNGEIIKEDNPDINDENFNVEDLLEFSYKTYNKAIEELNCKKYIKRK